MGFLDRALSMLNGDGGDSSGPRCEHRAVAKTESAFDATKSRSVARLTHR
jgi:hypothetical protein